MVARHSFELPVFQGGEGVRHFGDQGFCGAQQTVSKTNRTK